MSYPAIPTSVMKLDRPPSRQRDAQGFTLLEVMVAFVIGILALSAMIAAAGAALQASRIRAVAVVAGGIRFARTAVVRLPLRPGPNDPAWQIMTWE
jgi:type II secretory pathway pseudopilin PulG